MAVTHNELEGLLQLALGQKFKPDAITEIANTTMGLVKSDTTYEQLFKVWQLIEPTVSSDVDKSTTSKVTDYTPGSALELITLQRNRVRKNIRPSELARTVRLIRQFATVLVSLCSGNDKLMRYTSTARDMLELDVLEPRVVIGCMFQRLNPHHDAIRERNTDAIVDHNTDLFSFIPNSDNNCFAELWNSTLDEENRENLWSWIEQIEKECSNCCTVSN